MGGYMDFCHKRFLVLGLKKTGISAINFLKTLNPIKIYITDKNLKLEIPDTVYIDYEEAFICLNKIDYLIKSPGIPYDIPLLEEARKKNVTIINDIELSYPFIKNDKKIIGVTGSNGKTTTTTLIERLLSEGKIKALSAGNIGKPLLEVVTTKNSEVDVYVLELSSFQLLDLYDFKADINIFLNINLAHLDYHHSFEHYLNAKLNLVKNIDADSIIIYNYDDVSLTERLKGKQGKHFTFSLSNPDATIYINDGKIIFNNEVIMNVSDIKLLGKHNLYNIMPCIIVGKIFNITNETIRKALTSISGLPHRLEYVRTINEISFYNDSKSTNPTSTLNALAAFNKPIILLLGGYDRGQDFVEVIKHPNIKHIIAFGATNERICKETENHNVPYTKCDNLEEAVIVAYQLAKPHDIVLLSPASASWDAFSDYEERGCIYKHLINNLPNITI